MHPVVASYLASIVGTAPAAREGLRTRPSSTSSGVAKPKLEDAFEKRHKDLGVDVVPVAYNEGHPFPNGFESLVDGTADPRRMGGYSVGHTPDAPEVDAFHYNPNASREILAHEMGHAVTRKTPIGGQLHNMRMNKKLGLAIAIASGTVPIGAAMMTPGDDEYDEAMLGTMALASPTIINEALASKNGLAMLKDAGMPANAGQRTRLAGALLSYIGAPLIAGSVGTAIGNQFDENVPPPY
tara:strand:+ start:74 stop:793 length:720 start_codon:yes stop_codon:yes gene_type:complete